MKVTPLNRWISLYGSRARSAYGAIVGAAVLTSMLLPAVGSASTTIGLVDPSSTPGGNCGTQATYIQASLASSTPSYSVPAGGGVITSWSHRTRVAGSQRMKLKILRATTTANRYLVVGESVFEQFPGGQLTSFPVRIPVQAGDFLALRTADDGVSCVHNFQAVSGDAVSFSGSPSSDPATGSPEDIATAIPGSFFVNISATLEADADGDGYGDESQDQCTGNGAAHGTCPAAADTVAPVQSLRARKRQRLPKLTVSDSANESNTVLTAKGTVKVRGSKKTYPLTAAALSVQANETVRIALKPSKRGRRKIKGALRTGHRATAAITVTARDAAGNEDTATVAVKLKR